mmetsp:Transcript_953/g.2187  ORF Transcript_953/g.2187 Transcript_953/m.2187 type:complete len:201 (-) Transcript_953:314-916(-)
MSEFLLIGSGGPNQKDAQIWPEDAVGVDYKTTTANGFLSARCRTFESEELREDEADVALSRKWIRPRGAVSLSPSTTGSASLLVAAAPAAGSGRGAAPVGTLPNRELVDRLSDSVLELRRSVSRRRETVSLSSRHSSCSVASSVLEVSFEDACCRFESQRREESKTPPALPLRRFRRSGAPVGAQTTTTSAAAPAAEPIE